MTRKNTVGIWPVVAVWLVAAWGCGAKLPEPVEQPVGSADDATGHDGHTRMLALLETIRQQRPYHRLYLGAHDTEDLERALAALPARGADLQRFALSCQLGQQHQFLGNNHQAAEHILNALDLLEERSPQIPQERWEEVVFYLAVSYLRIAEAENCVHCHNGESCLLPIGPKGVHTFQAGSQTAIRYLTLLLERNDQHLAARWLLNVAYMTLGGYPHDVPERFRLAPDTFAATSPFPRFRNIATGLGLDTLSLSGGSIVDDFDNDGLLDIVVSSWGVADQLRFFRNKGDGTFVERTHEAGLTGLYGGLNLVQADYDNDGDIDILVLRGAWMGEAGRLPNSLLENDGQGRFRDVTFRAGLGEAHYPTQTAAWADYDNDGDLDLYIGNEDFPSQLFQNDGQGHFTDLAAAAGVQNLRYAKGVTWGDFDNDRYPDLYVSNLGGENRLYHNQGNGTFVDRAPELNLTGPHEGFPTWFWDFDNDGALDLFAASYPYGIEYVAADYFQMDHPGEMDHLYRGDGRGGFEEVGAEQGLTQVTEPMGANFGDVDNDGFLDFYLGTGYPGYEGLMPNLMFHNHGGTGFANVTTAAGLGHLQKGHGIAFADLDHDGDQDIFAELGGAYPGDAFGNALFENPGFGNHWIAIRLNGVASNRFAIGARIKATITEAGVQRDIYRHVNSGGSFGANPLRQQIGLGSAETIDTLEIYWPATGRTQRFENVSADQLLEITEDQPQLYRRLLQPIPFAGGGGDS